MAFSLSPFRLGLGMMSARAELVLTTLPDGAFSLSGASGVVDITVTAPAAYAGTYSVNLDDLATGPIFVVGPGATGDAGDPQEWTPTAALVLYDSNDGEPVISYSWQRVSDAGVLGTGATYTEAGGESATGLQLVQTAVNGAGSRDSAAVELIAESSYTEALAILSKTPSHGFTTPTVPASQSFVVFASFDLQSANDFVRAIDSTTIRLAADVPVGPTGAAMNGARWRDSAGTQVALSNLSHGPAEEVVSGDRVSVIANVWLSGGVWYHNSGIWVGGHVSPVFKSSTWGSGKTTETFFAETLAIGNGTNTAYAGDVHFARVGVWTGTGEIPDLENMLGNFVESSGALKDPGIARAALGGTCQIDWDAATHGVDGTHAGDLSAMTVNGSPTLVG